MSAEPKIGLVAPPKDPRIPLLVVGDSPTLPTGLARIARDVTELIRRDSLAGILPFRVAQLGLYYDGRRCNWHVYPVKDEANWGSGDVVQAWEDWVGVDSADQRGVIFSFWDPGRVPGIVWAINSPDKVKRGGYSPLQDWAVAGLPWPRLWGYFAVDACGIDGKLGGPVPEALGSYQRVLGYNAFGAKVLESTLGKPVAHLPHGIDLDVFRPQAKFPASMPAAWATSGKPIIGAVATNTPRKDWGAVFGALEGIDCHLWVHTDQLVAAAWSFPELAQQFGRNDPLRLALTQRLDDEEIAQWYSACTATIAPGMGEGWGYPIVESLACGTPVVHLNHAGGKGLVPTCEWRFAPAAQRLEGPYALVRPVVAPGEVRDALRTAVGWVNREPKVVQEYCRGSVAHLDWRECWSYWREWLLAGIGGL
jgi:glycosyltransferase involved in cell wall biosynthesis